VPPRIWALLTLAAVVAGILTIVLSPPMDERDAQNMTLLESAVLGTVEGLTEYLPVSSTGHLLVTQRVMGIDTASDSGRTAADAFAICIQAGAILAVLGLYFGRVRQMGCGLLGRDARGARLAACMLAGFAPAAVVGVLFGDAIKEHLFGPWPIVGAWAAGGIAILVVSASRRGSEDRGGLALDELRWRPALLVGLAQCIAMWPGVSRSLVTIVGGLLVGLSLPAAIEFSFLLGLVTLGAATAYDAFDHGDVLLAAYSPPALVVGLCFALLSALLSVRWLVHYLRGHGLAIFGWYRVAIAVLVAGLLLAGVI
jgi:undecaprenyl-diphosphatase